MPNWQYLTMNVAYNTSTKKFNWQIDPLNREQYGGIKPADTSNPVQYLQEVLGPDGWELVAVDQYSHDYSGGGDMVGHWINARVVRQARYWFKRKVD